MDKQFSSGEWMGQGAGRVNSSEIACYAIQAAREYTEPRLGLTDSAPSKKRKSETHRK